MRNIGGWIFVAVVALMLPQAARANSTVPDVGSLSDDVFCLAQNIYHEARGEPMAGKLAVGHVVMNRMADKRFPRVACSVIKQGGEKRRYRCQFSWWCDGRSDRAHDRRAWRESVVIAYLIHAGITRDPTQGALWYHATYVQPSWSRALRRQVKIGKHIFYTDPNRETDTPTQVADASENS